MTLKNIGLVINSLLISIILSVMVNLLLQMGVTSKYLGDYHDNETWIKEAKAIEECKYPLETYCGCNRCRFYCSDRKGPIKYTTCGAFKDHIKYKWVK